MASSSSSSITRELSWYDYATGGSLSANQSFPKDEDNTLKKKVVRKSKTKRDSVTNEMIKHNKLSYESRKTNPLSHMFLREKRKNYQSRKKYPVSETDYQFHYLDIIESYRLLHIQLIMMRTLPTQEEQKAKAKVLLKTNLLFTTFVNKVFMRSFLLTPCLDEHMKQVAIWLNGDKGAGDLKLLGKRIETAVSRLAFRQAVYLKNLPIFREFEQLVELRQYMPKDELLKRVEALTLESERFRDLFAVMKETDESTVSYLRSKKYREFLADLWKGYEAEYF